MIRFLLSVLQKLVLLAVSLCIAVLIAEYTLPLLRIRTIEEAVYQARRPVVQGMYGAYHPRLYYTLQKNLKGVRIRYQDKLDYLLDTNRHGFRGPDWDLSENRKNILLIGDSFGFGWGVNWDQTVGTRVERALQRIDPAVQVINLATAGWDLDMITTSVNPSPTR